MKSRLVVLSGIIGLVVGFQGLSSAAESQDAEWAEIETLVRGPKTRPKTREEAREMMKANILEFDAKAAAFRKAHPNDPRRWKLTVHEVQRNSMPSFVGLPSKSPEEIAKLCAEVIAAPDADLQTKAAASFYRASSVETDDAAFTRLAEAHLKEYPDFAGNQQLKAVLKSKAADRELKTKPLDLKFTATDGSTVDLEKLRNKVVLVDFWATWCGPCVAEVPNVVAAYTKLHDKGFEIVGISFDEDKAKLDTFVKEKGMTWPQFFDGKGWKNEIGQRYGIQSIPRMWLVNKKGMVVDTEARENLAQKVEKLLAE
jgi:thiol-disulfide isomerase/thioredoxin